ncbi:MAG: uroporphyrinogen decarboxylase family protein [Phycisphaerae bacterium]|nr:uroporphyrinogen decarboxylase family protein [Phycisphaerae bacterium]
MTEKQWLDLLALTQGKTLDPLPVGFIIDSPWLPGWSGMSTMDYFSQGDLWFQANLKAVTQFPDIMFLPGFWAEYGMCTEPSAFGSKCVWHENDLPFADKILHSLTEIDTLKSPNPNTDGLGPFILKRLARYQSQIEQAGHAIRFAVARGPLNVASFLMGATEFLMGLRDDTPRIHRLLTIITDYLVQWLEVQKAMFPSIDGILILDDIVGFCGEPDYQEFAHPYLKAIYDSLDVSVKMFHNDADGRVCARYLPELGINVFNFSFLHSIDEVKAWTHNDVVLLGNIPPRDVLLLGTVDQVKTETQRMLDSVTETSRILFSCGGGMPDHVSTANIQAFKRTVHNTSKGRP